MKIKTVYEHDKEYWKWETYDIEVDGEGAISVGSPEPEDASLTRDLKFAYDIVPLMKRAWEAGKRGEDFTVEKETDRE